MNYTRPDITYAVNCLSSHASAPLAPAFQDIKHLIRYLSGCSHHPIMHPAGLDVTTTHDLHKEVYPGDLPY